MKNTLIFVMLFIFSASIVSLVFKLATPVPKTEQPIGCTMEAKMCPDGVTYVGRTGPKCEFEACPKTPTVKTSTTTPDIHKGVNVTMSVGDNRKIDDLSITFNRFVQDSRCPVDVQCIQAGSAVVAITLKTAQKIEVKNLSSADTNYMFEGYEVKIISVQPEAMSKRGILESEYKITFHIEK